MLSVREQAIESLTDQAAELYLSKTSRSYEILCQSARHLPLGVASSFQSHYPYPFVVERGEACWVFDCDSNRYLDVHGGFGVNVIGHAHPQITQAIGKQSLKGLHFAAPHQGLQKYAKTLAERFDLEQLRLTASGTEATMDAIRFARAATGRSLIVKIEGAYHGHHDLAFLSAQPDVLEAGWPPSPVPSSQGLQPGVIESTRILALNDIELARSLFAEVGEKIAAVIIEPILCNLGFTRAKDSYLHTLRMLCDEYESVLIWDEVKTGATVAYKGVQGLVDIQPDLLCLGKAIGGGVPIGAVGGRKWVMEVVARGDAPHYGTFSGNPLAVAAGQAALDLLDESAYKQLNAFREKISQPIIDDIAQYNLPLHVDGEGAKGGIFCSNKPASDYRDWQKNTDTRLAQWGWLEMLNARVWGAPGADEQWTLSLGFDQEAVDWYLEAWAGWRDKLRLLPE